MKNAKPKKAFILAAGFGTRMQPLTHTTPKPLLPLWTVPTLQHTLDTVATWGVQEVLINVHHQASSIIEWLRTQPQDKLRVSVSYEAEILGTGGALKKAAWFLDRNPCWMLNADIAFAFDAEAMWKQHHKTNALATLWLHPRRGPKTVQCRRQRIQNFRSTAAEGLTFTGVQLFSADILPYLSKPDFSSIIEAYERAIKKEMRIQAFTDENPDPFWSDLGTPEQFIAAHREIWGNKNLRKCIPKDARLRQKKWSSIAGSFAAISDSAIIHSSAKLEDVIIFDHARVHTGSQLRNLIVQENCSVRGRGNSRISCPIEDALTPTELHALSKAAWTIKGSTAVLLAKRGSSREFIRIYNAKQKAIFIRYDDTRPENANYGELCRRLHKAGIAVPSLLGEHSKDRFLWIEDVGSKHLLDLFSEVKKDRLEVYYQKTIDAMMKFHRDGSRLHKKKSTSPTASHELGITPLGT